jgi:hypothetical protein
MGCLSWLRDLFGLGNKPVGPAGSSCIDFDGIDPNDVELKNLARLISMTHPRGTEERWKEIEKQLRKDLCEKDEDWEEKKALSAKGLLTRTKKVYDGRKAYVDMPSADLAKLMKSFDLLIKGKEALSEEAGQEAGGGAEGAAKADGDAPGGEAEAAGDAAAAGGGGGGDATTPAEKTPAAGEETVPKKRKKKVEARDYGPEAMKLLSQRQRDSNDIREDGFEYGEVEPEAFFNLLYKLKYIHGHLWPPLHKKDKGGGGGGGTDHSADMGGDAEGGAPSKKKK